MDYKQKYEEALEKSKKLKETCDSTAVIGWCEYIFPELAESKDEKIRKEIIDFATKANNGVTSILANNYNFNKWLNWLEKQAEQKPAELDIQSTKKGDILSDGTIVLIVDSITEFEGRPIINSWYFTDSDKFYGKGTSECDRWDVDGFRTATKVECSFLLKMMVDAGYEWDAEKKELKKIIDEKQIKKNLQDNSFRRMFEQNHIWSGEDDIMAHDIDYALRCQITYPISKLQSMSNWIDNLKGRVQPQPKQDWSEEDKNMLQSILDEYKSMPTEKRNWLQSLKDRYTWKPSYKQMKQLCWIAEQNKDNMIGKELMTLYNDLKKLRGE